MWLCNLVFATFTLPILICLVPLSPLRPLLRKKKKKKLHKYCFQYFLRSLLIPRRNWKQWMSNTFGGWTRCFMGKTKVVNRMPALALLRQYYNKKISPPKFASIDHSWVAPSFHFKARLIVWNVSLLQPLTRGAQGRETLETAGISDYKIKYEAIDTVKWFFIIILQLNLIIFHWKSFAIGLVLKVRASATQKWPVTQGLQNLKSKILTRAFFC